MKTKNQLIRKPAQMWILFLGMILSLAACNTGTQKDKPLNKGDQTLLGAGSTFVYPLFSKQFYVFEQEKGIRVNYQSIGSGGGILQLKNKTVDFGDSDVPLTDEQTGEMGAEVLHIPMCSGAVVMSYNIPGVTDTLNLNPELIAEIYLGKITKWNDARIRKDNPGVNFPDMAIGVVHRSDGSGTTHIFTDYLSKVNAEWNSVVGRGTTVNWPIGLGAKGNEGAAGLMKQIPGGIGYIELAYAIQNKINYARVQNSSGNYILPSIASVTAAGETEIPADSKVSLTNTASAEGYPISGFTWAIIYKEQNYNRRTWQRAEDLTKLLWWDIHEGQQYCAGLHYAPLSQKAKTVAENILKSATYDGKALLSGEGGLTSEVEK